MGTTTTTHKMVREWLGGRFFLEDSEYEAPEGFDPRSHTLKHANRCVYFEVFDCKRVRGDLDGVTINERKESNAKRYFPNSSALTYADVCAKQGADSILASNMKHNGWTHVSWHNEGGCPQPFDPSKDELV